MANLEAQKLAKLAWENMSIEANDELILIEVEFPLAILEWFDDSELSQFVANLIPLCNWDELGVFKSQNDEVTHFYVILWWSADGEALQSHLDSLKEETVAA